MPHCLTPMSNIYFGNFCVVFCFRRVILILTSFQVGSVFIRSSCLSSASSVDTYNIINLNMTLMTSQPNYTTRSRIECLQFCGSKNNSCGANVNRETKTCQCLTDQDFVEYRWIVQEGGAVFISQSCENQAQVRYIGQYI